MTMIVKPDYDYDYDHNNVRNGRRPTLGDLKHNVGEQHRDNTPAT
jgi:hypothetical protein